MTRIIRPLEKRTIPAQVRPPNRPKHLLDCGLAAKSPEFSGLEQEGCRGIIPTGIGLVKSTCTVSETAQGLIAHQQFGENHS